MLAIGAAARVERGRVSEIAGQDPYGFFVGCNECTMMRVCQAEAPGLIEWDEKTGVSRVVRQPRTQDEIKLMSDAILVCAMDAIRYGGGDPSIRSRLIDHAIYNPVAELTWLGRISRKLFYSSLSSK